ncbi:uncharacterized protein LOC143034858 [Oratosquilla oratoria]|uniref:uncharacterized protein LOC143034858 n=1 Tax=Oratosquilla oratoria TaxID=337810 RepID=UPI003F776219
MTMSARRSMSGLLPGTVVCGDEPSLPPRVFPNSASLDFLKGYSSSNSNSNFPGAAVGGGSSGGGPGSGRKGSLDARGDDHQPPPGGFLTRERVNFSLGIRSSDSDDSDKSSSRPSGSVVTSEKDASPGFEESSGSERSSGPPLGELDECRYDSASYDVPPPAPAPLTRSKTTPNINGRASVIAELSRSQTFLEGQHQQQQQQQQPTKQQQQTQLQLQPQLDHKITEEDSRLSNGLNRIRAVHELNMSKLAYLEALFQRAKLEEIKKTQTSSRKMEHGTDEPAPPQHNPVVSPDSGYRSIPSFQSEYGLKSIATEQAGLPGCGSTLPDGQMLLRTIESRLQQARSQDVSRLYNSGGSSGGGGGGGGGTGGGSSSGGRVGSQNGSPAPSGASTPGRYTSPSRDNSDAASKCNGTSRTPGSTPESRTPGSTPGTTPGSTTPGGTTPTRPEGPGRLSLSHLSNRTLPPNYRTRSAYSSPSVSPQRGSDPLAIISPTTSASVVRRFSSLDSRGKPGAEQRGSRVQHLPLRHSSHGAPMGSSLPLSPPSPAQGAQVFNHKMQLFLDIMETQGRFSQPARHLYQNKHPMAHMTAPASATSLLQTSLYRLSTLLVSLIHAYHLTLSTHGMRNNIRNYYSQRPLWHRENLNCTSPTDRISLVGVTTSVVRNCYGSYSSVSSTKVFDKKDERVVTRWYVNVDYGGRGKMEETCTKVKDLITKKQGPTKNNSVVYEVPCDGCDKKYIGEASRGLDTRIKEYQADVRHYRKHVKDEETRGLSQAREPGSTYSVPKGEETLGQDFLAGRTVNHGGFGLRLDAQHGAGRERKTEE